MARLARAFGMRVIAWSRHLRPERAGAVGAEAVSPEALLAESDILSMIQWRNLLADVTVRLAGDTPEGAGEREARFAVTGFLCGL